ncbi:MAG: hypothetical protein ACHREM_29750 [Polyangiales bacterium]
MSAETIVTIAERGGETSTPTNRPLDGPDCTIVDGASSLPAVNTRTAAGSETSAASLEAICPSSESPGNRATASASPTAATISSARSALATRDASIARA